LELQDVEDEMTDDELRLWMLLAYARPCSKPIGEINMSITQEKFFRKTAEKGDCEDVELHYQEELKQNKQAYFVLLYSPDSRPHVFRAI
jgi:hypothetical protein